MSLDDLSGLTRKQIETALEPLRRAAARIERIIKGGKATEFGVYEALTKKAALDAEMRRLEDELHERLRTGVDAVAQGAADAAQSVAAGAGDAPGIKVSTSTLLRAQADAAAQVVGIGRSVRTALNVAVVDALTGASDRQGFDAAIRDAMGPDALESRVERIARTELSKVYMGQQAANDVALSRMPGVDLIKRWVKSGKGPARARPEHDAIHGQERELDDLFDIGGGATAETPPGGGVWRAMGPLDPSLPAAQAIGCGCDVVRVDRSEALQAYISKEPRNVPQGAAVGSAEEASAAS